MSSYEAYKKCDEVGRQLMLRTLFSEVQFLRGSNQTLTESNQSMLNRLEFLEQRKGVPNELKVMQWKSKPPDNIA